MRQYSYLLLLLACLAAGSRASSSAAIGDSKLLNLMRETRAVQTSDPQRSLACFQYYSDVFAAHLDQYETEFAQCKSQSEAQQTALNLAYQYALKDLNNSAVEICDRLDICRLQYDTLDSLACYTHTGADNTKEAYNISTTASTYYAELWNQRNVIIFDEERCVNKSRYAYEIRTEAAYVDLQKCLSGDEPVPTTSTVALSTIQSEPTVLEDIDGAAPTSTVASPALKGNLNSDIQKIIEKLKHIKV